MDARLTAGMGVAMSLYTKFGEDVNEIVSHYGVAASEKLQKLPKYGVHCEQWRASIAVGYMAHPIREVCARSGGYFGGALAF